MIERLYKKDARDQIRFWEIECLDDGLQITFGVEGGEEISKFHPIEDGKANRDQYEQIESRFYARIKTYVEKKGYSRTLEEARAKDKNLNTLGFYKPMLAAKLDVNHKSFNVKNAMVQTKYDGHRCMIKNDGGNLVAYSRGGKIIDSIDHILDKMHIPEDITLDGELYHHGTALQTISSWVRRKQENSTKLLFHAYDVIEDLPFKERFSILNDLTLGDGVIVVPTWQYSDRILEQFHEKRSQGYEGLMIRLDGYGYEDGKRSRSLLKMKKRNDEEFPVIDIKPSIDDWAILVCETESGRLFSCSAPGSILDKKETLKNKENYIGKQVNVEFVGWTKDKVPSQPIAMYWRDKDE